MTTINYRLSWAEQLRLVWALARKDIVDALKTRTTLTTIILSLLMVAFYRALPALTADGDTLNVLLYAETESAITTALARSPALALQRYDSREQLLEIFADAQAVELAVMIPEAAASREQGDGPLTIDGYLMYWVGPERRAEIKNLIEAELSKEKTDKDS